MKANVKTNYYEQWLPQRELDSKADLIKSAHSIKENPKYQQYFIDNKDWYDARHDAWITATPHSDDLTNSRGKLRGLYDRFANDAMIKLLREAFGNFIISDLKSWSSMFVVDVGEARYEFALTESNSVSVKTPIDAKFAGKASVTLIETSFEQVEAHLDYDKIIEFLTAFIVPELQQS